MFQSIDYGKFRKEDNLLSQRRLPYRLSRDNFHVAQARSALRTPVTTVNTPMIKLTLVSTDKLRYSSDAVVSVEVSVGD
jgi:hypothetical protein